MRLRYINNMNEDYKYEFLEDIEDDVDKGIINLVNVINENPYFVTMNSCQGELIEDEKDDHCPITYVDFYVLNHKYNVANDLFSTLVHKFGQILECKIWFEPDVDYSEEEDCMEENGYINLRYRLKVMNIHNWCYHADKILSDLIKEIKEFNRCI